MSLQELFILMVIALILFGPEDLPDIARALGRIVYEVKKMFNDVTQEFQEAANTPKNVLQNAFEETVNKPLKQSGAAMTETQKDINQPQAQAQEELLTYDEENQSTQETEQKTEDLNEDPLADLPQEMVSREEKGASR